jgi:anti-anti-sigma factor
MPTQVLRHVPPGGHACTLVASEEQRWEVLAGFVRDGLRAQDQVMLVGMDAGTDQLGDRLRVQGVDLATARRSGRLVIVPEAETADFFALPADEVAGYLTERVDAATQAGHPTFRVSGMFTGTGVAPHEDALRRLAHTRTVTALCPYSLTQLDAGAIGRVRDLHGTEVHLPALYDDGHARITGWPDGMVELAGEIDKHNFPGVVAALDQTFAGDIEPIDLDLAHLRFIDAIGLRGLLGLGELTLVPRPLRLHRPRPAVRRLIAVLDVDPDLVAVVDGDGDAVH